MVSPTENTIPRHTGRTPLMADSSAGLSFSLIMNLAANIHSVREGTITPRLAAREPARPAVRRPTKVAQLIPRDPGVISAMATISITSPEVIQPKRSTSSLITGTMVVPPKLKKPILRKDQKSCR